MTSKLHLSAITLLALLTVFSQVHAHGKKLNVIIITADTLRGDMLGCNGNKEVKTPALDALASQGVNFLHAYTNITTTTPSHATIFSSLYPRDHKAYSNTAKISSKILTLDEIMKANGWYTAAIVNMPWLNPEISNILQGSMEVARCKHVRKAEKTNPWVLDFLDRRKKSTQPFYLWVHYTDNHTPYHAPGKYSTMYYPKGKDPKAGQSGSLQKVWKWFPVHHQNEPSFKRWLKGITDVEYVIAMNKGSVTWLDLHVGKIIERLKRNGQWNNTLVVFTADHGESLGEHNIWFSHSGLYQPTVHVPLIIHMPGGPAHKIVKSLVQLADLMPTILARVGLPIPPHSRGRDIWPLISKESGGGAVFLEHAGRQLTGVVTPSYKYIKHLKNKSYNPGYILHKGKEELYDLRTDPGEKHDISSERPGVIKEMRALWKRLRDRRGKDFKGANAKVDEQTEEMLRSLGYTQ